MGNKKKEGTKDKVQTPEVPIQANPPEIRSRQPGGTKESRWAKYRIYQNSSVATSTLSWFSRGFYISVALTFFYILLHLILPNEGEEVVYLTTEHLTTVQALLSEPESGQDIVSEAAAGNSLPPGENGGANASSEMIPQVVSDYLKGILLTAKRDSATYAVHIDKQLQPYNRRSLITALPNIPFKLPSFFWLTGGLLYLEIIFWSLFGVAASVLYRASEAISTGQFSTEKVPIHLAKILYAPLSTLIIIFSVNLLISDGSMVVDQISQQTIVLSFILGFFCGRTVELLRRIKDLVLPYGADNGHSRQASSNEKNTVKVSGRVYFPAGEEADKQLSAVTVWLSSMEDEEDSRPPIQADENGHFSFPNCKPGHFMLHADYTDEGEMIRHHVSRAILLTKDSPNQKVDMRLQRDMNFLAVEDQN